MRRKLPTNCTRNSGATNRQLLKRVLVVQGDDVTEWGRVPQTDAERLADSLRKRGYFVRVER